MKVLCVCACVCARMHICVCVFAGIGNALYIKTKYTKYHTPIY